jgi:hypothetical protein
VSAAARLGSAVNPTGKTSGECHRRVQANPLLHLVQQGIRIFLRAESDFIPLSTVTRHFVRCSAQNTGAVHLERAVFPAATAAEAAQGAELSSVHRAAMGRAVSRSPKESWCSPA